MPGVVELNVGFDEISVESMLRSFSISSGLNADFRNDRFFHLCSCVCFLSDRKKDEHVPNQAAERIKSQTLNEVCGVASELDRCPTSTLSPSNAARTETVTTHVTGDSVGPSLLWYRKISSGGFVLHITRPERSVTF
ncbi:uncharacterized protein V6R79_019885 [Siganus canaliculatus]